jgi:hypothetical protein
MSEPKVLPLRPDRRKVENAGVRKEIDVADKDGATIKKWVSLGDQYMKPPRK